MTAESETDLHGIRTVIIDSFDDDDDDDDNDGNGGGDGIAAIDISGQPSSTLSGGPPTASAGPPTASGGPPSASGGPPSASGGPPFASAGPPSASGRPLTASGGPPTASAGPPFASGRPPTVSELQNIQELASDGSDDDECPVLVNEKARQAMMEDEDSTGINSLRSSLAVTDENDRWHGHNPLQKFSLLIGTKKLTFKIVDAPKTHTGAADLRSRRNKSETDDSSGDFTSWNDPDQVGISRPVYKCKFCGRAYAHKQPLLAHEKTHSTGRPYQCPICTKCFARQVNFSIHMRLHASGRRYFCSFCGKWFRTQPLMIDHQQKCLAAMNGVPVPTDRPLRYRCYYCEKMFHHRRDKNIHERTHTGERPYTCGYCSKGFTQSQALTIHIRSHTGERPYSCSICGKEFRDSSALRKHEFIKHIDDRLPSDGHDEASNEVVLMTVPNVI